MTILVLTLPLARRSLIHIPRRDLVLDYGDSLTLALTIVAADTPDAAPVDLDGLGQSVRLLVFQDTATCGDYGRPALGPLQWSTLGTIAGGTDGRADIAIPRGTANRWHGRLGWGVQLERMDDVSLIAWGALHLRWGAVLAPAGYVITDSADAGITDDIGQEIGVNG